MLFMPCIVCISESFFYVTLLLLAIANLLIKTLTYPLVPFLVAWRYTIVNAEKLYIFSVWSFSATGKWRPCSSFSCVWVSWWFQWHSFRCWLWLFFFCQYAIARMLLQQHSGCVGSWWRGRISKAFGFPAPLFLSLQMALTKCHEGDPISVTCLSAYDFLIEDYFGWAKV